jgi:hypothetical protein
MEENVPSIPVPLQPTPVNIRLGGKKAPIDIFEKSNFNEK